MLNISSKTLISSKGEIMSKKIIGSIQGVSRRFLRAQWKNLFDSKHNKISQGASEEYKSHPRKARGDNWRRPDAHDNQAPKKVNK